MSAATDIRSILDAIETKFIWSRPTTTTVTGTKLWQAVRGVTFRAIEAEVALATFKADHGRDVDELRGLCDVLTRRIQELEGGENG